MNWTEYLTNSLKEQRIRTGGDKSQRALREKHFNEIAAKAYQAIDVACSANKIQTRFYEEAGHNICIGEHRFRMHLVGKPIEMEITVYLEPLGGGRDTHNLPHITNADGNADILHLTADDICRYLLDRYLMLADSKR